MLFRKRLPVELGNDGEEDTISFLIQTDFQSVPIEWGSCPSMRLLKQYQKSQRVRFWLSYVEQPLQSVWITHLGFVVRHSENDVRIRHATKMGGGVVKEHYLKWYFEHIRLYLSPMEGVLVLMPQEQTERHPKSIIGYDYSDTSHSAPIESIVGSPPSASWNVENRCSPTVCHPVVTNKWEVVVCLINSQRKV